MQDETSRDQLSFPLGDRVTAGSGRCLASIRHDFRSCLRLALPRLCAWGSAADGVVLAGVASNRRWHSFGAVLRRVAEPWNLCHSWVLHLSGLWCRLPHAFLQSHSRRILSNISLDKGTDRRNRLRALVAALVPVVCASLCLSGCASINHGSDSSLCLSGTCDSQTTGYSTVIPVERFQMHRLAGPVRLSTRWQFVHNPVIRVRAQREPFLVWGTQRAPKYQTHIMAHKATNEAARLQALHALSQVAVVAPRSQLPLAVNPWHCQISTPRCLRASGENRVWWQCDKTVHSIGRKKAS